MNNTEIKELVEQFYKYGKEYIKQNHIEGRKEVNKEKLHDLLVEELYSHEDCLSHKHEKDFDGLSMINVFSINEFEDITIDCNYCDETMISLKESFDYLVD